MNPELIFWLAAMIAFGVLEAATAGVVSLWFVGGSAAALIAAVCGISVPIQAGIFLIVSIVLLACLRPFFRRYVNPRKSRTNADRILDQRGVVTQTIDNLAGTGAVKVSGTEWTARSADDRVITCGQIVRILKIEGVKIFVEPEAVPAGKGEL